MATNFEQLEKQIEEEKIRQERAKKRKEQRLKKFLREHGSEIVEIEEPCGYRGMTTTKVKLTRNELAQHQAFVYSKCNQRILMRLKPKKSKK